MSKGLKASRWPLMAAGAAGMGLVLALGGCAKPSPPVGLADCFESLPLAEGALNLPKVDYTFKGAKLVSPKTLDHLVKRRYPNVPKPHLDVPASARVCAFAFTGTFAAGEVAGAPAQAKGKAAIVLTTTDRRLLFSFVLASLPANFSRTFTS